MTTFEEFCQHYGLEADTPDSQEQYRQYLEARDLMMLMVSRGKEVSSDEMRSSS